MNTTFWLLIVGIIGLVFVYWQCYLMRKSRESELLMQLTMLWNSDEYIRARKVVGEHLDNLAQKTEEYEQKNEEDYFLIVKVGNFFEHLGVLVDRNYLPRKVLIELLGSSIKYYYEIFVDYITQYRKTKGPTNLYIYFERLAKLSAINLTKDN